MYSLTYLFYCMSFSSLYCGFCRYQFLWVLQTWWETWVPAGLFSLALVWTLLLAGLMPRQVVPCWFRNDIMVCPCLSCSWNPLAFRLQHCLSLQIAVVYLGLVQDVSDICLPLYLDWHMTDWQRYSTPLVAFAHSTVFHWWVWASLLLVCFPLHYQVLFYGTSFRSV